MTLLTLFYKTSAKWKYVPFFVSVLTVLYLSGNCLENAIFYIPGFIISCSHIAICHFVKLSIKPSFPASV